jgi:uncharacterized membrane protein YhhN
MTAATIISAVACLVLVYAEWRKAQLLRIAAKTIASFAFVFVGVVAIDPTVHHVIERASPFQFSILLGLVFGALGDLALLGSSKRAFMLGLAAFLVGHLLYVLAWSDAVAPSQWLYEGRPWGFIPIAAGIAALAWLWRRLGSLRVPVILYILAIVAMVVGAIAMRFRYPAPAPNANQILAGSALFFVSDLAVARDKFVQKAFVNRAWGLPAYYAAQLLIASSLRYA